MKFGCWGKITSRVFALAGFLSFAVEGEIFSSKNIFIKERCCG
jgi:hypothetical protein